MRALLVHDLGSSPEGWWRVRAWLEELGSALDRAGASFADVVRVTYVLPDGDDGRGEIVGPTDENRDRSHRSEGLTMPNSAIDADALLERLAEPYLARPDVTWGRMFSSTGLSVRGKIFAVVNHAGHLMVKIPEARADALETSGEATHMVMRGREMREWVEMPAERGEQAWAALLDEAYHYLDEITPR